MIEVDETVISVSTETVVVVCVPNRNRHSLPVVLCKVELHGLSDVL